MAEKKTAEKNGNGKGTRSSGSWVIEGFGKVVVPIRLYSTAKGKDERASFHNHHVSDQGRARRKFVCEICGEEMGDENTIKGQMKGDKLVSFTDEELMSFKKSKSEKVIIKGFKQREQFTPNLFSDTQYVGTAKDGGAQPFKLLHETMKEKPNLVALVEWVKLGHDHTGIMSVFGKGFIVQEIIPKYLFKDFSQVTIQDAEVPHKLIEKGMDILKKLIDEKPFNHDEVEDEYAATINKVVDLKLMGEEIPVVELPQKKAEATDLEAMLDAS